MMQRQKTPIFVTVARGIVALAILAAVVGQLVVSVSFWAARGDDSIALNVLNFFSFFTIESNILAMVTLVLFAVMGVRSRPLSRGLHLLVLCVTTYMVVTGIVYNILLRGIELPQGSTLGWSNEILHLVAPLWMLIDWLLSARLRDVRYRDLTVVAVFPVVWLAYSLVRGPMTPDQATGNSYWYPYPFLNPETSDGGYVAVAITCVVIAAVTLAVAALLVLIARARRRALTSGRELRA